jgi:AcrR family transcriptional regulator
VGPSNSPASEETTSSGEWREFPPLELTPILAAALDAFHENGFHGATVREIARRVGLTVPSLYYHYESKEGLLAALLELGTSELASRVRDASRAGGDSCEFQFENVVEAIVLHMVHRHRVASLDSELRHLSPSIRQRYSRRRKAIEDTLGDTVRSGIDQGVFSPKEPTETVRALLGMCQSVARWYSPGGALSQTEVASRYVDIALMTVGRGERRWARES